MPLEMLVGVNVTDAQGYAAYRRGMTPILAAHGGAFGYDLEVSAVLRSPTPAPMNRVFTIRFPDAAARDAFFADPAYQAVRTRHFVPAVSDTTILASWEVPATEGGGGAPA